MAACQNARGTEHESSATLRWENALDSFRKKVEELNRRINVWNLKAPSSGIQRKRIDIEVVLQTLL